MNAYNNMTTAEIISEISEMGESSRIFLEEIAAHGWVNVTRNEPTDVPESGEDDSIIQAAKDRIDFLDNVRWNQE